MQLENQGLTLWSGTADAPGPDAIRKPGEEVRIRIGVAPADASNRVSVAYRVNGGSEQTAAARWIRNDSSRDAQYFEANLGHFRDGDRVEYTPMCVCAGRRVPSSEMAKQFVTSFDVLVDVSKPTNKVQLGLSETPTSAPEGFTHRENWLGGTRLSADNAHPESSEAAQISQPPFLTVREPLPASDAPPLLMAPYLEPAVPLPIPAELETPSPTLQELVASLSLNLNPTLLSFLAGRGIRTLADIRKAGGIGHIEGLPVGPGHLPVRTLEAHANLSLLPTNVHINAQLIERGYTSPVAIASRTRTDFVAATADALGVARAGKIFAAAQAQTRLLSTALADLRVNEANYALSSLARPELLERPCECKDCRAAVSPGAYLVDLTDYALTHLKEKIPIRTSFYRLFHVRSQTSGDFFYTTSREEVDYAIGLGYTLLGDSCYVLRAQQPGTVPLYRLLFPPSNDHFYTTSQQQANDAINNGYVSESVACYVYDTQQPRACPSLRLVHPASGYHFYTISEEEADLAKTRFGYVSEGTACYVFVRQADSLDIPYLANHFHQPFGDLPLSCEAMQTQLRQVRLCIEVLWRYLDAIWPTVPQPTRDALADSERAYAQEAYRTLLVQLGTSYDEIRLIRSATADEQRALADRLGIDLQVNGVNTLSELFLAPAAVTQSRLEELFGLVDTRRDPFTSGQAPKIQTRRLGHLRTLWRGQDWPS